MSAYSVARVRRSLLYFVLGKGLGIVLGIGLLLTLVRVLSVEAYNFYLISQAVLIIINQLSSLGFEPTVRRFLPELLSRSEGRTLSNLTKILCKRRFLSFIVTVFALYPFTYYFALANGYMDILFEIRLFLLVVVFELFCRFLDLVFDSFLMQGVSQISMLLRSGIRLLSIITIILAYTQNTIELKTWIIIDICASFIGCLWGIYNLKRFLSKTEIDLPGNNIEMEFERYRKYAVPSYIAGTVLLVSGPDMVKILAAHILPPVQFASFGFALNLIAMFNRYLPMNLIIGMIRPLFVNISEKQDYTSKLPKFAEMVFKLNFFSLMPILVFIILLRDQIAIVLTGGRYPEAGGFLLLLMPLLIVQSLRSVISLTALALEDSRTPLHATLLSLLGIFVGISLSSVIGADGFSIGLILSGLIYSIWVTTNLKRYKLVFNIHWIGHIKILISGLITAYLLETISGLMITHSKIILFLFLVLTGCIYLLVAYLFKPFKDDERNVLNTLFKKKVFLW